MCRPGEDDHAAVLSTALVELVWYMRAQGYPCLMLLRLLHRVAEQRSELLAPHIASLSLMTAFTGALAVLWLVALRVLMCTLYFSDCYSASFCTCIYVAGTTSTACTLPYLR